MPRRDSSDLSDPDDFDESEVSDAADDAVDLLSDSDGEGERAATPAGGRKRRPAPGAAQSNGASSAGVAL